MIAFVLFLICLAASTVGALVGAGGGVIIKPVVDLLGLLPVSMVSFLSGCTVLAMSCVSLVRTRNNGAKLRLRTSTPLAVGAVAGGFLGKWLFELVRAAFSNENVLGFIQALCLTVVTIGVLLYVIYKRRLPSKHVESPVIALIIGVVLGTISSFLGIGGGPYNVAVLFFFFSMDAKEAAKNSIYIIVFSQLANLITAVAGGTVPDFSWLNLVCMAAGGIGGAFLGAAISKRIDNRRVETALKWVCVVVICINIYNVIKFSALI